LYRCRPVNDLFLLGVVLSFGNVIKTKEESKKKTRASSTNGREETTNETGCGTNDGNRFLEI